MRSTIGEDANRQYANYRDTGLDQTGSAIEMHE
jgi:hypothetical protein